MDKLNVHGGATLHGTINISGSKNASLPILAASLLTDKEVIIRRVPDVSDTNYMVQIISALGGEIERSSGTIRIDNKNIIDTAPYDLVRRMRASICVMGPLLARSGRAVVSLPGGCVIGDRPVDLHLRGLEALGAKTEFDGGNITITAPKGGLKGAEINLRGTHGPTVLGTDNVMMAAVFAEGTTVIESAAAEPEVEDLANFLNSLGAKIEGAGTRRITIHGVTSLGACEHTVIPDRIEAGTFMAAAVIAGDGVTLRRVCRPHMEAINKMFEDCGHRIEYNDAGDTVTIHRGENPIGGEINTAPFPGYPTDMQAQMTAVFATTPGISVVKDTIFPQRFMHCAEMKRMGADINVDNGTAIIKGVKQLSAAPVMASDLRASAALVLAGLTAKGTTTISRLYHIDRGYEHIDEKLLQLHARVERVKE
jgi:UDP-N-acetylglucosamine 1-carboxyvinyltransferase